MLGAAPRSLSRRRWKAGLLALFVLGPLIVAVVAIGVDRRADETSSFEACRTAHRIAVERARARLLAGLPAWRAEIAAGSALDGVGEYSWRWRSRSTCGNYPSRNLVEHLLITPTGEAAWWFGMEGPERAEFLDLGRVRETRGDAILVDWELAPTTPHRLEPPPGADPLLDGVLVRIRDEPQSFLVPACRIGLAAWSGGRSGPFGAGFVPRLGGWPTKSELRATVDAAGPDQVVPWSRTPSPWFELTRGLDRTADGERVDGPVRQYDLPGVEGWWNWMRGRDVYGSGWRSTYDVRLGYDDGVRAGMVVSIEGRYPMHARVVGVTPRSCRVDVREFHRRGDEAELAPEQVAFRWHGTLER